MEGKWLKTFVLALFALGLASVPGYAQTTLISTGADWSYLDDGTDQGTAWQALGFDDASWMVGPAPLGYGNGGEATTNTFGGDDQNKIPTYYYRHVFNVTGSGSVTNLRGSLRRDDGALVYLNGTEIFRSNMDTGSISFTNFAAGTAPDDGNNFNDFSIDASLLVEGDNILAVEIHQANGTSSDIVMDFGLLGNPQPSVDITSPTNTQAITAVNVAVQGTATPGGQDITLVEVFADGVKVGDSTSASWVVNWENIIPGNYTLTATILDSSGLMATSAPVDVTIDAIPESIIIPRGSSWLYLDGNVDPDPQPGDFVWTAIDYDDSSWSGPAPGPLGGGDGHIVTTVNYGPGGSRFPSVLYRRSFNIANSAAFESLEFRVLADDGAVVFLNGNRVINDGIADGTFFTDFASFTAGGADETEYTVFSVDASLLVDGENVVAVMSKQTNPTSSDLGFDLEVEAVIDNVAPTLVNILPPPTATVRMFNQVEVFFSEEVQGVDASDLLINGEPADVVEGTTPGAFVFTFVQPATGAVSVAWAPVTGITDLAPLQNPFVETAPWNYVLDPNAEPPGIIISEFMASNDDTLNDEDGDSSDWIEVHNAGNISADLGGWHLTDNAGNLTKWTFPNVTILPQDYLIVFASNKDRTNNLAFLHANFTLRAGGEYLALVDPQGNIVSEFAPTYPEQETDISYGRARGVPDKLGFFPNPTPGAANSQGGSGFSSPVIFSRESQAFQDGTSFTVELSTADPNGVIRFETQNRVPDQTSPIYTGTPINVDATTMIRARVFDSNDPDILPGPIQSHYYIEVSNSLWNDDSNLPQIIMHTWGGGTANSSQEKFAVTMVWEKQIDGRATVKNPPDLTTRARIKIRGSSTAGYAKQSWAMESWDELNQDVDVSMLGMPEERDWVFYAPNNFEPSLIHNRLAHVLSQQIGRYGVRQVFAEVYYKDDTGVPGTVNPGPNINSGDYNGIYVILEKIKRDRNRVDIDNLQPEHTSNPEVTGGYLLKIDRADPGDSGFSAAGQTIRYVDPKEEEIETPQRDPQEQYIRNYFSAFGTALNGANYRDPDVGFRRYIDEGAAIDHHLHNVVTFNVDAFRLSGYFHKTRDSIDQYGRFIEGKVFFGPSWDFDRTQGSTDGRDTPSNVWRGTGGDRGTDFWRYTWWSRMYTDPDFYQLWIDRYQDLRAEGQPLHTPTIINTINTIVDEVRERQPQEQARWTPNPRGGSYEAEIEVFKRQWFTDRLNFIDSEFLERPILNSTGGVIQAGFQLVMSAPEGGNIYYTMDGTDPRASGGGIAPGAMTYNGAVTINANARVMARAQLPGFTQDAPDGPPIDSDWSGLSRATFITATAPLIITEMMYNPAEEVGDTNDVNIYEFIELKNIGTQTLSLDRFRFTEGILFNFSDGSVSSLAPGATVVVVADMAAYMARYGAGANIAGEYLGNLANNGEQIVLMGYDGEIVHQYEYDDRWYPITDGLGFSLVVADEAQDRALWDTPQGWRVGSVAGGSPGQDEAPAPNIPVVLVNEALTHTDAPLVDAIELFNPNAFDVDIGGWFLSDDRLTPKYEIDPGTMISAGGYLVFTDDDFNQPGDTNGFNLRSSGDEVYLYSGDGSGNLTGYLHGYDFGASLNGIAFGRYVDSTGQEQFVAQSANTLGAANAGPKVGPIVISEIMYRPPELQFGGKLVDNERDEFIELYNISGQVQPLFDPNATTNAWRLDDAVRFEFPLGEEMQPGEHIVVVGFDPSTNSVERMEFRNTYGIGAEVRMFGPWRGRLGNADDDVELVQPDVVRFYATNIVITGVLIDKVDYRDEVPWPLGAAGLGPSLQRIDATAFGNDPINWASAAPSFNAQYVPGPAPMIAQQPQSQTIVAFMDVNFTVVPSGNGPFSYQWLYNGAILPGETGATLSLTDVQPSQAGGYQVVVLNAANSTASDVANLTVLIPADITQQPERQAVLLGESATFNVVATSSSIISYQWRKDGVPIPGATQPSYSVPSVTREDDGFYDVVLTDAVGPVVSDTVRLAVLVRPVYDPIATRYNVIQGQNVTISVSLDGTLPMGYRWRRNSSTIQNEFDSFKLTSFLTLMNVQPSDGGTVRYTCVATNEAFPRPGRLSPSIFLTVLMDGDGDGMSDDFENANGLNASDPSDANGDLDGDGASNRAEHDAGTDPNDPNSVLRIESIATTGETVIEFNASSNTTYTVQFTDQLEAPMWMKLQDVAARPTEDLIQIIDPGSSPTGRRFYRLATPRQAGGGD